MVMRYGIEDARRTIRGVGAVVVTVGVALTACGGDDDEAPVASEASTSVSAGGASVSGGGGEMTTPATSSAGGGEGGSAPVIPDPPVLGAQIDRHGRPAINPAVNRTFTDDATRNAALDQWNANDDPSTWPANHAVFVRSTLAWLDAFDGTCGNQLGFGAEGQSDYAAFAGVLTNDWLTVRSDAATCLNYMSVELSVFGAPTVDCGGRRPTDDVVEATYSVVAAGATGGATGLDDGIGPRDTAITAQLVFPYLEPAR